MSSDIWLQAKEILPDMLELPAGERNSYLNKLNVPPEVRVEIESLLAFEDEAEHLMQLSAFSFSKDIVEDEPPIVTREIGSYRIISELGHGGMGAVYLAERVDGKFEQRVALKLLKRELNTAALRRRFKLERDILSRLDHPSIARLLDAGTTEDGIPFLAMEFVDGLPIDQFCARGALSLKERLELFEKVCSAVDFAHRNLIVHRDLKPSNILVTADGTPKLLDFGISKILGADVESTSTVTRLGVMTPGYASPEQLKNESVTTATDVYSLGVVLYELLCGHRPFQDKESNVNEIFRAVVETEPPFPSAVASQIVTQPKIDKSGDFASYLNTKEGSSRVTRAPLESVKPHFLRGDIDNIVLKAMKKDVIRRYASPENLADDIRRHLAGLPVTARPDTLGYRTGKFIARHRFAVMAGALILVAVIAGAIATLWQARKAEVERAKAEQRFSDVRSIANSFITEFSPMIENIPGTTAARKLLVTRAVEYLNRISAETSGDVQLKRELAIAYEKVGDVQGNPYNPNIGDVKGALASYERAIALRDELRRAGSLDDLDAEDAALFEKVGGLHANGGDYDKAIGFHEKALSLREAHVARDPLNYEARRTLARALRSRGLIPFFEGNNKEAIQYYTRALDIYEQLFKERPDDDLVALDRAYILVGIGEAYGWDSEFKLAGEYTQKGLDLIKPLAAKYPNNITYQRTLNLAYNKRAENYEDTDQSEKAVDHYSAGLDIAKRISQSDPQNFQAKRDVAMGFKKMSQALDSAGRSKESEENMIFALNAFRDLSLADPNNAEALYDVANTRFSLGETYMTLKDFRKALETFNTAKAEFEQVLSINPENVYAIRMSTYNLDRIGKCHIELSSPETALEYFKTAYQRFEQLKSDGKLGDYDIKAMPEMKENLDKLVAKLKAKS